jgi:hypothetical protein
MSTLTIGSLVWHTFTHEGKTAYQHNRHVIVTREGIFHLVLHGKSILSNPSISKLLEEATPAILDYYADNIYPSWEDGWKYDGHSFNACEETSRCPQHKGP